MYECRGKCGSWIQRPGKCLACKLKTQEKKNPSKKQRTNQRNRPKFQPMETGPNGDFVIGCLK